MSRHDVGERPRTAAARAVAQVLGAAAAEDWAAGEACLPDLEALPPGEGRRMLREIVASRRSPKLVGPGLFLLGAEHVDVDRIAADLLTARRDVSARLDLLPPDIVVDVVADDLPFALAEPLGEGCARIRLTPALSGEAVIRHEMVHAILRCGNRLLDEGLADWFAEGVSPAADDTIERPAIEDVLDRPLDHDVHFDSIASSYEARAALRRDAARLIDRLHAVGGPAGIVGLFDNVRTRGGDGGIASMVEASLTAPESKAGEATAEIEAIRADLHTAQPGGDADRLAALAKRAFALAVTDDWRPIDLGIVALLGTARERLRRGDQDQASTVAVVDAWLAKAKALSLPAGRASAIAAHRTILALMAAQRANMPARISVALREAERHLQIALADDPDDRDAQFTLRFLKQARETWATASAAAPPRAHAAPPAVRAEAVSLQGVSVKGEGDFQLAIDALGIKAGERVALVGANGSGKSTLIDAVLGLVPFKGTIRVLGREMRATGTDAPHRARVGAVLNHAPLSRMLKVREAVRLLDAVYRRSDAQVHAAMGLDDIGGCRVAALSRGQTQRLMIYAGLGHDPELLLLDEASLGLDARHAAALRALLFGPWGDRRTTIICSHLPSDLDRVDRVILLGKGRIVRQGGIRELLDGLGWRWRARLDGVDAEGCATLLAAMPGHVSHSVTGRSVTALGDEAFGRAFTQFAASHPATTHTLERTTIRDVIEDAG